MQTVMTSGIPSRIQPLKIGRTLPRERIWPQWVIWNCQVSLVVLLLASWEIGVRMEWIDPFFWSSPSAILDTALIFIRRGDAFIDTWFTFRSTILGFIFGTLGGAIVGLSFWWSRNYSAIFEPFILIFHAIPKLALGPLVILVFGMGLASKVAMAIALTIVVSILNTYSGVQAVDGDLIRLMYSLGANRWQVFTKVVIPSAMPWIISSLRVNIGLALAGAIVGEFISSQYGLGRKILYAGSTYDIALIWVATIVLSTLAMVMYWLVIQLEKWLLKGVMHKKV
ncbi:ABC transporter permease [Thermostichus vulcanus]|uniref:ABC transporter permease n=1 Tax=Thermostichus vulcanus str. 'Rupite' TaxID=2813851 RepID=A0ABT0CEA0_THEVL|nr:ABC transporter permease [Thermostichus vulcanus]MCJ2544113.1 ABC transporter permease [Thermostichus vulcanus str. 'Rupite']